jgi:hypothetical protein
MHGQNSAGCVSFSMRRCDAMCARLANFTIRVKYRYGVLRIITKFRHGTGNSRQGVEPVLCTGNTVCRPLLVTTPLLTGPFGSRGLAAFRHSHLVQAKQKVSTVPNAGHRGCNFICEV